ncbi:MAG: short-chain dehydrogenase/reductase [Beijerinckiaceae bacterium]
MDLKISGRKALITGGSKGIGLAAARAFLAEGAHVVLVARDAARLAEATQKLGSNRVETYAADLSQGDARAALAARFPDIDMLVNNAGAIPGGGLETIDMAAWEQAWSLKVMGYIHLTQLYLAPMRARGSGVIVNVIGSAGRTPRYDYICGGTGNAALMAFTGALGGQSADWGVRIFGINPAATRTDRIVTLSKARAREAHGDESRWEDMLTGLPFARPAEPEEIAAAIVFLSSPACGYVSGATLDIDGGGAFRKG